MAGPPLADPSVVVASFSGERALVRCLESLTPQCAEAELIVATDEDSDAVARLEATYPSVRFLRAPRGTSVFRLRALGAAQARGRLVALVEDHCTVAPGWLAELRAAHAAGHSIVGGPVDNGLTERTYDWALYFCEYAAHMPPLPGGPATILSGLNVAYDRAALEACRETWRDVFYESEVHLALARLGHGLHRAERAWVASHLEMPLGAAMAHLFSGARRYGRHRRSQASPVARALLPVGVLAVPVLSVARLVRSVATRRPALLGRLTLGMPYVVCLVSAWSWGEALGYLTPSAALARS